MVIDPVIRKGVLKIGAEANLTLSLAEGTVEGALHLPDKDGGNLLSAFTSSNVEKLERFIKEGRECRVRISVKLAAHAFVGGAVTVFAGLPNIDFSPNPKTGERKKDATLGVEAKAGVTATGGGTLAGSLEWKDHDDPSWLTLASVSGRDEWSIGIAAEANATIEYRDGKFRIKLGAGAVAGRWDPQRQYCL